MGGQDVAVSGLKTFRCRMRASGSTITIECVAPSAEAAAYVVARHGLHGNKAPWVQIVVAQWSGVLGEFVDPGNAIIVSRSDTLPDGADRVVFSSAEYVADKPRA